MAKTMTEAVNDLRNFVKDRVELNELLDNNTENSNEDLQSYIEDALDEINNTYMPITSWDISSIPSWNMVKFGAVLQLLTSNGIISARNTYNYSDGFGLNIENTDYWGRYINYYNVLVTKYNRMVTTYKRASNIDACYGGIY